MQDKRGLTPAERELELALARLRPAPTRLDRDRLMFLAGQQAKRRSRFLWPAIAAGLAAALCLTLAIRPQPPLRAERIVYVPVTASAPAAADVTAPADAGGTTLARNDAPAEPSSPDAAGQISPRQLRVFLMQLLSEDAKGGK